MQFSFGFYCFSENGQRLFVVTNIFNRLIFIAVFFGSNIIIVTGLTGNFKQIVFFIQQFVERYVDMLIFLSLPPLVEN